MGSEPVPAGETWRGTLLHVHVAEVAAAPMRALEESVLVAGVGLGADRYATRSGTYSERHHVDRQVTLIEAEVLEALARDHGVVLAPHEHRRNLTTRGVPLGHLVGRYFTVGPCVLYGGRTNVPCRHLEHLVGRPVFRPLVNRSGLNARVVVGGTIHVGDPVAPFDPSGLDPDLRADNEREPVAPPPEVW